MNRPPSASLESVNPTSLAMTAQEVGIAVVEARHRRMPERSAVTRWLGAGQSILGLFMVGDSLLASSSAPAPFTPSGPHYISPSTVPPSYPKSSEAPASASPSETPPSTHPKPSPTEVAPGIDLIQPSAPVSVEYLPPKGRSVTFGVGKTKAIVHKHTEGDTTYVDEVFDPPLVYCPGTDPVGVTVKHSVAKTQAECHQWYQVTDYGNVHTGPDPKHPEPKPLVLAAHTSSRGYYLSGNLIAGIDGGILKVTDKRGDVVTYRIRRQHFDARKNTDDLIQMFNNVPNTSVVIFTCFDSVAGANDNDVIVGDLVVATAAQH